MKLTGRGVAFPPFEAIRANTSQLSFEKPTESFEQATPTSTCGDHQWSSRKGGDEGVGSQDPERMEVATTSADAYVRFRREAALAGRFDFRVVPPFSMPNSRPRRQGLASRPTA